MKQTCREFARVNREYGLWGAESEEERHLAGFTIAAPVGLRSAKYRDLKATGMVQQPESVDHQPATQIAE